MIGAVTAAPLTLPAPPVATRSAWLPGYLALAAIWGSSFLFIKVGLRELHPVYITLGRVGFGALTLGLIVVVTRTRLPRGLATWGHLTFAGVVGVAVPFTLFGYGEQHISSVLAGIWNATTPLATLPVAVLVFRTERMSRRRLIGLGLGFVGVLTILGVWRGTADNDLVGQLECFAAALCYAVAIPYQRRFLAGRADSGVALAAGQLIVATGLLAVVAPLVAGAPPTTFSLPVVGSVAALGALGTGIAFALNFRVIRLAGASTSASVTYLAPLWATAVGFLVLGERLSWYQPVGAAIVLLGVGISQGVRLRRAGQRPQPAG
jgi:drug/metabolite transporter (DMT)-like permease